MEYWKMNNSKEQREVNFDHWVKDYECPKFQPSISIHILFGTPRFLTLVIHQTHLRTRVKLRNI